MSTDEVKRRFRETVENANELLDSIRRLANAQLERTAPKLTHALDSTFDQAGRSFAVTLAMIGKRSKAERRELLKAYGSFLKKQQEIIDRMGKSLDDD